MGKSNEKMGFTSVFVKVMAMVVIFTVCITLLQVPVFAGAKKGSSTMTIMADPDKPIMDASYSSLFGGDTTSAIKALVAAGAVKINGMTLPVANAQGTYSANEFDINGGKALWQNADGTWSWEAHLLFSGANKSYDEAIVNFVNDITKLRGISYTITLKNGTVSALNATVYDVAMADTVQKNGKFTTMTLVGAIAKDGLSRMDPSTVQFPNRNVLGNPKGQDVVLYWNDVQGWHLQRAESKKVVVDVTVTTTDGKVNTVGTINGAAIVDSRLSLGYSQPSNRPSQPIRELAWLGISSAKMIQWTSVPGVTIGFSMGKDAENMLKSAIDKAKTAINTVVVSTAGNGSDVEAGKMWVTQDYMTRFTKAVSDAQAVLDKNTTSTQDELALYVLAQAYGGTTGDRFSFLNNTYFGSGTGYDTGYNGTGFWTFAQAHVK